ncbi:hypothetical protein DWB68_15325 [Galactobacter valiniphilus]|uniref:Bro-N domain-containing protein n=1 Tax=Galactobacter valiniphilus TaxID=2676122 RepID=A0A399J674_9MICC|nr:Bro-N domain-containing protein [Galactobacter valiniphilus]RII40935.1 hypothetical protein DWB68_15325 [Galactobacter valiniphilus]
MNTALTPFTYADLPVRVLDVDGEPWFVASDVAKILGYASAKDMTRRLDADEKGGRSVPTLGGVQTMTTISEPGLYVAVLGSQVPGAKDFKRWVTHEVLPQIRRTGAYSPAPLDPTSLEGIGQILAAGQAALERAVKAEARAEVSEARVEMIEHTKGFSIREFKKHYFPDVPEGVLNTLLYEKGLLINQRGTKQDKNGNPKDGPQHRHPSYSGNKYFFISWYIDEEKKTRHGSTLVRPGTPETELVAQLERWGLARNKAETQL